MAGIFLLLLCLRGLPRAAAGKEQELGDSPPIRRAGRDHCCGEGIWLKKVDVLQLTSACL
uniref:G6F-LY6G6D fusion protein n=1 Tax=Sus scrofa TaxID=9823 RepID=A0A1L6ZAA0_PIG|nr:G6F-LY6G6D fusion protein [Sus scrofa]